MNFESLRKIERKFDLKLPGDYSNFILNYPSLSSDIQHYLEETIANNIESVILNNECFRDTEFQQQVDENSIDNDFEKLSWSNSFFVIGTDGCFNYYFTDTATQTSKVYFLETSTGEVEYIAKNINGLFKYFKKLQSELV